MLFSRNDSMIINRDWDVSKWLSVDEAAKVAGVCRKTMFNWIKAGHVRVWKTASGRTRIDPSTLGGEVKDVRTLHVERVTKLEVIGPGMHYVNRPVQLKMSVTDGGKTLKVLVSKMEVRLESQEGH
jgi:excisionase family DNA binding protein